ncbi:MAG: hypothetical protein HY337_04785 [Gemmatimonadetes bacterium]|nr:hypothetical protein [Gemmatimonadota bacterium]
MRISISSPGVIRPLETAEDYGACIALQEETWGQGFADRVPASLLLIAQKVGGIVAGAFEPDGSMAGFVLGFTGIRAGRPAHWSHMLAVRADRRDRGVGRALKRYQRDRLLKTGVDTMYWTFDPLVARNANLNLNELGAVIEEYVVDLYGPGDESPVDSGIGTDRLVVRWDLRREEASGDEERRGGTTSGLPDGRCATTANEGIGAPVPVRIEIPPDIQELKHQFLEQALEWRSATRRAFRDYLGQGYRVVGFERSQGGRGGSYVLTRSRD